MEKLNDLIIRKATLEDVPVIRQFILELSEYEKLRDTVTMTEELLAKNLFGDNKYAEVLLADVSGKAVGFALFFHNFSTFTGKPGIYLEDLYIRPEERGGGYGKSLLLHLLNLARERDCGRVEWAVLDWNEPAINFYKSLGAIPMDDWTIFRMIL